MNANEFKAQERAKNEAKFGRWASMRRIDAADPMKLLFEQAPRNELESAPLWNGSTLHQKAAVALESQARELAELRAALQRHASPIASAAFRHTIAGGCSCFH